MTAVRIDDESRLPIYVMTREKNQYGITQSMSNIHLSRVEAQALIHVLADFIDHPED